MIEHFIHIYSNARFFLYARCHPENFELFISTNDKRSALCANIQSELILLHEIDVLPIQRILSMENDFSETLKVVHIYLVFAQESLQLQHKMIRIHANKIDVILTKWKNDFTFERTRSENTSKVA